MRGPMNYHNNRQCTSINKCGLRTKFSEQERPEVYPVWIMWHSVERNTDSVYHDSLKSSWVTKGLVFRYELVQHDKSSLTGSRQKVSSRWMVSECKRNELRSGALFTMLARQCLLLPTLLIFKRKSTLNVVSNQLACWEICKLRVSKVGLCKLTKVENSGVRQF